MLTLGFARRFATYKRPNLLLHDPRAAGPSVDPSERPVQLILAGKAHPADLPAQALIQEWVRFVRRDEVRPHAVFLSDYDMFMTERLVEGVDTSEDALQQGTGGSADAHPSSNQRLRSRGA